MSNYVVPLAVSKKEEQKEICYIFLLEDLIKEYNHRILSCFIYQNKKSPLSLYPLKENSINPVIPLTQKKDASSIQSLDVYGWLKVQFGTPKGLTSNIPTIYQGLSIARLIWETELKGKVMHIITKAEKIIVALKDGDWGNRNTLRQTRYFTDPEILASGLEKKVFNTLLTKNFIIAALCYTFSEMPEVVEMLVKEHKLKKGFLSKLAIDVLKIAAVDVITTATEIGLAALVIVGAPADIIVLVVGLGFAFLFDNFDEILNTLKELLEKYANSEAEEAYREAYSKISYMKAQQQCGALLNGCQHLVIPLNSYP